MRYAKDWLEESQDVLDERGKDYDKENSPSGGERSMLKTVWIFNMITGHKISEAEGWLLMQVLKDVRQWTKPEFHEDSALDCISYAALKAEALEGEVVPEKVEYSDLRKLSIGDDLTMGPSFYSEEGLKFNCPPVDIDVSKIIPTAVVPKKSKY